MTKTHYIIIGAAVAGYILAPQLTSFSFPAGVPNPFAWVGQKTMELAV